MDGTTSETCAECGFDSRAWQVRDAGTLLGALGLWWRLATDGIASRDLNERPAPGVWSALEYGQHSALVTAVLRGGIELILAHDGVTLPPPPAVASASATAGAAPLDATMVLDDIEREAGALGIVAGSAAPEAWANLGHSPEGDVQAEAALFHAVHDATHHQMDLGRGLALTGRGTPAHVGQVVSVNASDGGVPKHVVASGWIGSRGLAGDRQADRKHHGRPFQALCLWSAEVIAELAGAGHQLAAGRAGENLTVSGVDWRTLRPGARLQVGTALAEISFPATPCAKQARWFADGDFTRIGHDNNPQWTRWYAWVRTPGEVRPGDPVIVQP